MDSAQPIIDAMFYNASLAPYKGWNPILAYRQWRQNRSIRRLARELAQTEPTEAGLYRAYYDGLMSREQALAFAANTDNPPRDYPHGWRYSLCGRQYISMPNHG